MPLLIIWVHHHRHSCNYSFIIILLSVYHRCGNISLWYPAADCSGEPSLSLVSIIFIFVIVIFLLVRFVAFVYLFLFLLFPLLVFGWILTFPICIWGHQLLFTCKLTRSWWVRIALFIIFIIVCWYTVIFSLHLW